MSPNHGRIAIIGGGYAGMSAAVELCLLGRQVTVFEAGQTLGGRARRVVIDGKTLDNGLHILIGAYRQTLQMIDTVAGTASDAGLMRLPLQLIAPGHFELRTATLPAPLNVLAGLITANGLCVRDKLGVARMMLRLRLTRYTLEHDHPVSRLLQNHSQTESATRLLWNPLCLAALNTLPESASAQTFMNVLRDTFAAPARNSDLLLPTLDFSRLFPDRAADFVRRHDGRVQIGTRVQGVRPNKQGVLVELSEGSQHFSASIIAVAPQHLSALIRDVPELSPLLAQVAEFDYNPIYSIYLGYPAEVRLARPMLGLHGGLGQWVFDRGQLGDAPGSLGVVISAPGVHQDMTLDALAFAVHQELKNMLGKLPDPHWHQVIAEKRATYACVAGLVRPAARTPASGIYLAGDYVQSGYPATLEAAVRSGITAAHLAAKTA